jgi:hypothetical protein
MRSSPNRQRRQSGAARAGVIGRLLNEVNNQVKRPKSKEHSSKRWRLRSSTALAGANMPVTMSCTIRKIAWPGEWGRVFVRHFIAAGVLLLVLLGSLISARPANAEEWCGVRLGQKSRVQCGYSSLTVCRRMLGGKKALCFPNPIFADMSFQVPMRKFTSVQAANEGAGIN